MSALLSEKFLAPNGGKATVEAKISESRRMCGLDNSDHQGYEKDRIWTTLGVMALKIRKPRDIDKRPELIL